MSIRFLDANWAAELEQGLRSGKGEVRVVAPFIKEGAAAKVLRWAGTRPFRVITRFNLGDIARGVSDIEALRSFLEAGAEVRGIKGLHAKMYATGRTRAIVTSANLTQAGLSRNEEAGLLLVGRELIAPISSYFDRLWNAGSDPLTHGQLDEWARKINDRLDAGPVLDPFAGLPDEGAAAEAAGLPPSVPGWLDERGDAFLKFHGEGHNRSPRTMTTLEEVARSGVHWACSYPRDHRPRMEDDGSVLYIARMVSGPDDTMVFGRAIARRYRDRLDDASKAEIARRPWKKRWPHYVWVDRPEFIAGTLGDGVSVHDMINELGWRTFVTTAERHRQGERGINARLSVRQQPSLRITDVARAWIEERLEDAFGRNGPISARELNALDWSHRPPD